MDWDISMTLRAGRDAAGHRLAQGNGRRPEGRFASYAAATTVARNKPRPVATAGSAIADEPLTPTVPFRPAPAQETTARRAAA